MARAAFLALLVLVVGASQADAAVRAVPRGWLGVTADGPFDTANAAEWRRMARNGVETARTAFIWSLLQPGPASASAPEFDFSHADELAVAAAKHGIALVPVVQGPPAWAAVHPGVFHSAPADPGTVRRLFAALANRYGPRGSLWRERRDVPRRPIRAWQVFNEPNLRGFWSVQPFHGSYVATVEAAERGIHSVDPSATVVLAGLPNRSWEALSAIYAAGGRGSFDAVAIHPYSGSPEKVMRIVRYARRVMRRNGDERVPIWVTEFSWPATREMSDPSRSERVFGRPITNAGQARLLGRTMRIFARARRRLGIERLVWYTWISREVPVRDNAFNYAGLRRIRNGAHVSSPALRVFRRWARRLEGCAKTANAERCR